MFACGKYILLLLLLLSERKGHTSIWKYCEKDQENGKK